MLMMRKVMVYAIMIMFVVACNSKRDKKTNQSAVAQKIVQESADFMPEDCARFMQAALDGELNQIKQFIAQGMDVNYVDQDQRTALLFAAYNGQENVVKYLLAQGADVNKTDISHSSALMFASSGPFIPTVKALIAAGADLECTDNNEHWNAVMWAAAEGQTDVLKVLVEAGADFAKVDIDGESAYDFAIANSHKETAAYLKQLAQQAK